MKTRDIVLLLTGLAIGIPLAATAAITPDNSGLNIPYRGRLDRNGVPAQGNHVLRFWLYKGPTTTTACSGPKDKTVTVVAGEFSTVIDNNPVSCFTDAVDGLWVGAALVEPGQPGPTVPWGRQRVYATPFAMASSPTSAFILQSNAGNLDRQPTAALHVERAWGTQPDPLNGLALFYNTSNAANAHATLGLRVAGTAAGNPFVSFDVAGEAGWSLGMDNQDGNRFKIAAAWNNLGNPALTITPGNAVSLSGDLSVAGNVSLSGNVSTGALTVGSPTLKRTCPGGWTSVNIGLHSSLCILRQGNNANYRGQTDFCRGTHNAQLCTFQQMQLACGAGFGLTADTTLADRIRDDTHLIVNSTDCNNFDGESAFTTNRPAGYCCIQ